MMDERRSKASCLVVCYVVGVLLIAYLIGYVNARANIYSRNKEMDNVIFTNDQMMDVSDLPNMEMCHVHCNQDNNCKAVTVATTGGKTHCVGYSVNHITRGNTTTPKLGAKYYNLNTPNVPTCTGPGYILTASNQCVRIVQDSKTQVEADGECQKDGGRLVIIDTLDKLAYFQYNLPLGTSTNVYYIGGDDIHSEGTWTWWNGQPMSMSNAFWRPGNPNNRNSHGQTENCAVLDAETSKPALFNDINCSLKKGFICEKIL